MTGTVVSGRAMERVEPSVHFQCKEDDGSYLFLFPRGERIQVPENDVERSFPLRYMLESVANCGDTTIPEKVAKGANSSLDCMLKFNYNLNSEWVLSGVDDGRHAYTHVYMFFFRGFGKVVGTGP